MKNSSQNLKTIRFEGELLPSWAQLLDLAARLAPVIEETKDWFSRLTNSSGVADAHTVTTEARTLQNSLRANKAKVLSQLQGTADGVQSSMIFAAWEYSLETMIQAASSKMTCSWIVEGSEGDDIDDGPGDISLRRV